MKSVTLWIALGCAAIPAHAQEVYDLLLKGGHVIDPANKRNGRFDVAILGGKIAQIAPDIPAVRARTVIPVGGYYVTPGLIDLHAYVYPRATAQGIDPDHNSLRYGVTTVVDGGSTTAETFEKFRNEVIADAAVRILAFIQPGAGAAAAMQKHPDVIVGLRAPAPAAPGEALVLSDLGGGILTRVYAQPVNNWKELRSKGAILDVGHGADGLLFRLAVPAIKAGLLPDTISTGLDSRSVLIPRPTMTAVMSRFVAMGLSIQQIIERTTANPARAIKRTDLGGLAAGSIADIALFEVRQGKFAYLDAARTKLTTDREIRCVLTIRDGKVVWDTEGLSLTDWQKAGPYSNFK